MKWFLLIWITGNVASWGGGPVAPYTDGPFQTQEECIARIQKTAVAHPSSDIDGLCLQGVAAHIKR